MTDNVRRAFLAASPAVGDHVSLDPDEAHHVHRVLRLTAGDAIAVFDGKGGEWTATIENSARDLVTVIVGEARTGTVEPALRVVLFQAVARPEKIEWVLQKGTEVGVAEFRLVASERVETPPPSPGRMDRYARIVMEACKQSGRRRLPPISLGAFPAPAEGVLAIVLSPDRGVEPLGTVLSGPKLDDIWLAVGPEGGFSPAELDSMIGAGWRPASLGPRVLRTETAGVVAAAIVLHTWGDLGRPTSRP